VLQYYKNCQKEQALSLPLLSRIANKSLILQGYKLTDGICYGLGESIASQPKLLNTIVLDNNGLCDEDFSKIIKGMCKLDNLKSLVIKKNEISRLSFEAMIPILQRKKPYHLEELRIISCKIRSSITHDLVETMSE